MKILYIPKLGASDIEVKITSIKNYGVILNVGDVCCDLETSKTSYEVDMQECAYFYPFYKTGDKLNIGDPFAIISSTPIEFSLFETQKEKCLGPQAIVNSFSEIIISKKAKKLITENGLNPIIFGKQIIGEKDVLDYLDFNSSKIISYDNLKFSKNDLVIIGIGGHAGMCIDILKNDSRFNLTGFVDDKITIDYKYGLKYLGSLSQLPLLKSLGLENVILGIGFVGNLKKRDQLYSELKKHFYIPTIIHEKAIIETSVFLEDGCQIMAGAVIGSNVKVFENCIINSGAIVSHDSIIGYSSHITPGAILAGHVELRERVTIGMGATIYIGLKISADKVVPNGKAVFESL